MRGAPDGKPKRFVGRVGEFMIILLLKQFLRYKPRSRRPLLKPLLTNKICVYETKDNELKRRAPYV